MQPGTVGRSNRKQPRQVARGPKRDVFHLKLAAIFINPPPETHSEGITFSLC